MCGRVRSWHWRGSTLDRFSDRDRMALFQSVDEHTKHVAEDVRRQELSIGSAVLPVRALVHLFLDVS